MWLHSNAVIFSPPQEVVSSQSDGLDTKALKLCRVEIETAIEFSVMKRRESTLRIAAIRIEQASLPFFCTVSIMTLALSIPTWEHTNCTSASLITESWRSSSKSWLRFGPDTRFTNSFRTERSHSSALAPSTAGILLSWVSPRESGRKPGKRFNNQTFLHQQKSSGLTEVMSRCCLCSVNLSYHFHLFSILDKAVTSVWGLMAKVARCFLGFLQVSSS